MARSEVGGSFERGASYSDLSHARRMERSEAIYELIAWSDDERPVWWRQDVCLWKVKLRSGRTFTTNDLEAAYFELLASTARCTVDSTRRALFFGAPKSQLDQPVTLEEFGATIVLTQAAPFLREQTRLLRELKSWLRGFEEATVRQVLATAQAFALKVTEEAEAGGRKDAYTAEAVAPLFDPQGDFWHLGVPASQLQHWAKGTRHYELIALCEAKLSREQEARQRQSEERHSRREEREERQQAEAKLARFVSYLEQPDFEPVNDAERVAMLRHMEMEQEADWHERQRLREERDEFILQHVIRGSAVGGANTATTVQELLAQLQRNMTPHTDSEEV